MTTADYALIVSILSLLISLGGLAWNVWSKFIYPKARVRVGFQIMSSIGFSPEVTRLTLSATNLGPGKVRMHMAIVRVRRKRFGKLQPGFLTPLATFDADPRAPANPFAGGMRTVIDEGEDFSVYFPYQERCFLAEPVVDIGFVDTLSRKHWVPRKFVRKVRSDFLKAFPNAKPRDRLETGATEPAA